MGKNRHEFRDPIHGFVTCNTTEREVIDSRPFQRLRHIRQLAMSPYVYPGATHTRFEHSLGVMELATRIFDVIFNRDNLPDYFKDILPEAFRKDDLSHWRKVVRMAALCHDLGHLPFSHGAEALLPNGVTHEKLSWDIIHSEELCGLWKKLHVTPEEVGKVALGQKEVSDVGLADVVTFTTWEDIMSEIITGNMFGADRMDYLLRDSYHAGVMYGHFDVTRLVDSLRLLAKADEGAQPEASDNEPNEPCIGIEFGGLHAATALLWARYSMFSQVYYHDIRCIYDIHLVEVIREIFPKGYPLDLEEFLGITDNEILAQIRNAAYDLYHTVHIAAARIEKRQHFRQVCQVTGAERAACVSVMGDALQLLFEAGTKQWGKEKLRQYGKSKGPGTIDFPVRIGHKNISAVSELPFLEKFPVARAEYIFAEPEQAHEISKWFDNNRGNIIPAKRMTS